MLKFLADRQGKNYNYVPDLMVWGHKNARNFLFLSNKSFNFSVTVILLSANALNLDWYKILLFGKELNTFQHPLCLHLSAILL